MRQENKYTKREIRTQKQKGHDCKIKSKQKKIKQQIHAKKIKQKEKKRKRGTIIPGQV